VRPDAHTFQTVAEILVNPIVATTGPAIAATGWMVLSTLAAVPARAVLARA
jgi:hypothetical protein